MREMHGAEQAWCREKAPYQHLVPCLNHTAPREDTAGGYGKDRGIYRQKQMTPGRLVGDVSSWGSRGTE